MGIDKLWRKKASQLTAPSPDDILIDMCCGTGDFAAAFTKLQIPPASITACDFSEEMILAAQKKMGALPITFATEDCTATTYSDNSFDIATCAFGARNLADLDKGIGEMHRLLKANGKVCILEFSLPKFKPIRLLYLAYFIYILPILGWIITGDLPAYKYLVSSVRKWDKEIDLPKKLSEHGFEMKFEKPVSFGIATIYIAYKCST